MAAAGASGKEPAGESPAGLRSHFSTDTCDTRTCRAIALTPNPFRYSDTARCFTSVLTPLAVSLV